MALPGALAGEKDPRAAELAELDRKTARELVSAHKLAMRKAKEPAAQMALLRDLAMQGRSPEIVKALKTSTKSRNRDVRLDAIRMLGTQRGPEAQGALLAFARPGRSFKLLRGVEAVRSLGYTGYGKKGYALLDELFWDEDDLELRRAIIDTYRMQQETRAFSLLAHMLDQPQPDNPNSASNPPASYWRDKYEEWRKIAPSVYRAMEEITGQQLRSKKAALAWVEENGEEAGIEYERLARNPWM